MASQINLFDGSEPLRINKPIRLIELFAGYGSQALALKYLGIPFEHWGICEIDKFAVQAYNALHDTDYIPSDITKITASDLRIEERDKYEYIMTYSFPCTDLSLVGKRAGMEEGSGTRSSLLWEVRRLLVECGENLPQILLMENVPQVIDGAGNFAKWLAFLYSLGYESRYAIMDAGDYGIPQSRRRCFCLSWLTKNAQFSFPSPFPLNLRFEDIIEQSAPDDYFFSQKQIDKHLQSVNVVREREREREQPRRDKKARPFNTVFGGLARTLYTYEARRRRTSTLKRVLGLSGVAVEYDGERIGAGTTNSSQKSECFSRGRVCGVGGGEMEIRSLTERETFRLMGVRNDDIDKLINAGISSSQLYKLSGNSIVTTCLMAIFGELTCSNYKAKIKVLQENIKEDDE